MIETQKLKQLLREAHLDIFFLQELENPKSEASGFFASFTLNFIVKNLPQDKRAEFSEKLSCLQGEESKDYQEVWDFVNVHIPDFEERFIRELTEKLEEIKEKT